MVLFLVMIQIIYLNPFNFCTPLIFTLKKCAKIKSGRKRSSLFSRIRVREKWRIKVRVRINHLQVAKKWLFGGAQKLKGARKFIFRGVPKIKGAKIKGVKIKGVPKLKGLRNTEKNQYLAVRHTIPIEVLPRSGYRTFKVPKTQWRMELFPAHVCC